MYAMMNKMSLSSSQREMGKRFEVTSICSKVRGVINDNLFGCFIGFLAESMQMSCVG